MRMRGTPHKQATRELMSTLDRKNSTRVNIDGMTLQQIRQRIMAIKMWDSLYSLECPLCGRKDLKLDSKVKQAINLSCRSCDTHYAMSLSRSLGARLILK